MTQVNELGMEIKDTKQFSLIPEGQYDFILHGIVSLGMQSNENSKFDKTPKGVFKFIFELPEHIREDEQTSVIGCYINATIGELGAAYKLISVLLGSDFDANKMTEYLTVSGLKNLLGKTGILTIYHTEKNNRVNARVAASAKSNWGFLPLDPRLPKPQATRETFLFTPGVPDLEVFKNTLTYWTQKEVMSALNASSWPKELHEAWVEIESKQQQKKQELPEGVSTEAIE
jgi:hypothetical protein